MKIAKYILVVSIALLFSVALSQVVYADEAEETPKLQNDYVIVLDSGHDVEHIGARGNGVKEEQINLIITEACKAELEKYNNITVYMTHDGVKCPYPGTEAKICNKNRCEFAASVGADYFISIHANYNYSRRRNGFEIIYPNDHYKPEYHTTGKELSEYIVEELKKSGMLYREIWTRNSDENKMNDENYYPDGSRADYYNVIRNTKYNDILGIIIEHGYLSNWSDVKNFLSSEEKLKELGVADANGIINYLIYLEDKQEKQKKYEEVKEVIFDAVNTVSNYFEAIEYVFN